MPLSAKFEADFSTFYDACQKAEVSLKSFEGGAAKAEGQLNSMADALTGRKLISDATLMAEAVQRVGGTATLTATQLMRVRTQALEAEAKLTALGKSVPPEIRKITDEARGAEVRLQRMAEAPLRLVKGASTAGNSMTELSRTIGATDNVLDAFGVHLGDTRRALDDIGEASGKTISQLGFLGTASLVAGVALGSWKLGRFIAESIGADRAISDLTAKVMGLGDAAAISAGAKQDILAKATKIAGVEITNLTEAMRINAAQTDIVAAFYAKAAEAALKLADAAHQSAIDSAAATSISISNAGKIAETQKAIEDEVKRRREEAAKQLEDEQQRWLAATQKSEDAITAMRRKSDPALDSARFKASQAATAMSILASETRKTAEEFQRLAGAIQIDVTAGNLAQLAKGAGVDVAEAFELARQGYSFEEIVQILSQPQGHRTPTTPPKGSRIPGFDGTGGGSAPRAAASAVAAEAVSAIGPGGGGTVVVNAPIYVSGVFDPASARKLAEVVSEQIVNNAKLRQRLGRS